MAEQREREELPLGTLARGGPRTAYLAGAGGSGMRGLATFLLECGWRVWGADRRGFPPDDPLLAAGLVPLDELQAPPPVTLAVRSAAVPATAPAFSSACAAGARGLVYAQVLGEVSRERPTLAVAGSHGKTTTSAWIAFGLRLAGRDPGFLIGGEVPQLGRSAWWGSRDEPLIAESCEFDRSFHRLRPRWAALLNVDAEHPDTYPGGLPEVLAAFRRFLALLPADGLILAGPEAPEELAEASPATWIQAEELPPDLPVGLPGRHNRRNAALVAAVLRAWEVPEPIVRRTLAEFRGAGRRMEEVGLLDGALVVSDYAHHPAEVRATLQALEELHPGRRRLVVFQPHQARRFTEYREDFVAALDRADALVLLPIYRARDPEDLRADVEEIRAPLQERRPRPVEAVPGWPEADRLVRSWARPGDLVVCLGAGDVDGFARRLVG
ncbi:MAG: hypothetical protein D6702_05855 [Planctomycetota bacterium]|nr:MAG: hypothetical protein D6702_05855 [Planctomycetota bacterium]